MNQKFTRARRLTRKGEFDRVFSFGHKITHNRLSAWLTPAAHPRLGLAISKKYGNNVRRQQLKRRLRAAFRGHYDQLPPADIVITAAAGKGWIDYSEIEHFFTQRLAHVRPEH